MSSMEEQENEAKKESAKEEGKDEATVTRFCTSCDEEDEQLANVFCRLARVPLYLTIGGGGCR